MADMIIKNFLFSMLACSSMAFAGSSASAATVVSNIGADLSASPYTFDYAGSSFTFGFNGDYFGGGPVTIKTSGGGEVNTIFGQPTTNFIDRGVVTFGPSMQYAAFSTATPIKFTNGDNFIGLRAVAPGGGAFYGYAYSTNNVLNTIGFETVADTIVTATTSTGAVPELAVWAMMIAGFGLVGAAMRRRVRAPVANAQA
jgi:hypothetical protein